MNFVEQHCPTPPAPDPKRKRSPRHRRTTPSSSPRHGKASPQAPRRDVGTAGDKDGRAAPITTKSLGAVRSPRRGTNSTSLGRTSFGSKTTSPRDSQPSATIFNEKQQLASINTSARRSPSPDVLFNEADSKSPTGTTIISSPLGSAEGLRPIVPPRRARSTSPLSFQPKSQMSPLSPSLPTSPTSSSDFVRITHDDVLGTTTTIRTLSLEPVMLGGSGSRGNDTSPKSGGLIPIGLSGSAGRRSLGSSRSSLGSSDGARDFLPRGGISGREQDRAPDHWAARCHHEAISYPLSRSPNFRVARTTINMHRKNLANGISVAWALYL